MSETMILPHDHNMATEEHKREFRNYLSKLLRVPPATIDKITATEAAASNIWNSLKGLTGVTAKCHSANNGNGGHGIKMGGVVLTIAAHCPESGKWIEQVDFENAPGSPLLFNNSSSANEIELWNKLHAFLGAVVPQKGARQTSNLKSVSLLENAVCITMNQAHFPSQPFSDGLSRPGDLGCACIGFKDLHNFLNTEVSCSQLNWKEISAELVFEFKTRE